MRENKWKTVGYSAIDLFCGCGGLTVGLQQAGFQVVGAIESNPLAAETYRKNHPNVFVWEADIRTLDPVELKKQLGLEKKGLDLLAGCPPCQGFSRLRTKNGALSVDDERNDLLFEFERFAAVLRPQTIMMENVPWLADDERFSLFCEKIRDLGYVCDHKIMDAAEFGVPQRRKRLIFLGGLKGGISFAVPSAKRQTVRDAIGCLPSAGSSGDALHDSLSRHQPRILNIIRQIPKDGGSRICLPKELWLKCHCRGAKGFKDVYGRMSWRDVSPTITSGCVNPSKGRFLHPDEDRAITLREASILQGFPSDYIFPVDNRTAASTMIGNALPPPFIAAHAKSILVSLKKWNNVSV